MTIVTIGSITGDVSSSHDVVILGAGAGGLGMAVNLQKAGLHDYVIFEKSDGVGGTWRVNTYPGAACDVQSHLYSFSFELNPNWSRRYASQPEILAYFEHCADKYGLRHHLRCNEAVVDIWWVDDEARWHLRTSEGNEHTARIVISALGLFSEPFYPEIPGLDEFAGPIIHSARWDHSHSFANERVAVIGTGASAIQIIPELQRKVEHLEVFQRSAPWIMPRIDNEFTPEQKQQFADDPEVARRLREEIYNFYEEYLAFRTGDPALSLLEDVARAHLTTSISDPDLRAALTPDYPIGAKRILVSSNYYPAMSSENVELQRLPIVRITKDAIITGDGTEHSIDTIVLATGFRATEYLQGLEVAGVAGRLHDCWQEYAYAYLGITVPGFPNFFILYGPNTNQGGNSIIFILEAQAHYIVEALRAMERGSIGVVNVRQIVLNTYERQLDEAFVGTVWATGTHTYFHSASGRIVTQMPYTSGWYRSRVNRFEIDDYHVRQM